MDGARQLNSHARSAGSIEAALLLAGGLKPSPLARAARSSPLDLHLTPTRTVLGAWLDRLGSVCAADAGPLVRVITDARSEPARAASRLSQGERVMFEREPASFRGPAGALRDVCAEYDPDSHVIVGESARWVGHPIAPMIEDHFERGADITVGVDEVGLPTGVFVVRCATIFDLVPARGFMDLKEQWLSRATAAGFDVRVHVTPRGDSAPLRTRGQLLEAASRERALEGLHDHPDVGHVLQPGQIINSAVVPGSVIGSGAAILNSVVMADVEVGEGAVVAHSILVSGARVAPGEEVVGLVLTADGIDSGDDPQPSRGRRSGR